MNEQLKKDIEWCLWRRTLSEAPALIEPHLDEIDFNDDDDVKKINDFIITEARTEKGTSLLEYFISKGFDINFKLPGNECLILRLASSITNASIFEKFVQLGADVYSENNDGDNVLLLAARSKFVSLRKESLSGLEVHIVKNYDLSRLDKTDGFGRTPLMYAVINDKRELAEALIEKGSDVNGTGDSAAGDCQYWLHMECVPPLTLAIQYGNAELVKKLLAAGAKEELSDTKGFPPVFSLLQFPHGFEFSYDHPVIKGKCEIVGLLKNLDLADRKGYTVLIQSLTGSGKLYLSAKITAALIEKGANVNAVGNDGKRAIHYAAENAGADVVKALVKAGADVNVQDNEGNSPLLIACKYSDEKTARYLLKAGADFNVKNNNGESPADLAAANGLNDVLELMI